MGVRGLWDIISPAQAYCPLAEIGGQTVAIDLSIWICKDKSTVDQINLHFRLLNLLRQNTLPVAVTDGLAPQLKLSVMKHRLQKRDGKYAENSNTKATLSRPQFSKLNQQCIALLDAFGLPYVQSPGEAEAMCALMNAAGLVEACITNDGDAFLYGAHKVYRHFSMDSRDSSVRVYHIDRIEKMLHFDQVDFIIMGLLLGCDYWPNGVSGLGKANVLRLLASLRESNSCSSKPDKVKFMKWLISVCPPDVNFVANGPYMKFGDRKITHLWLKVRMALQNCPVDEIFTEFLSTPQERSWSLPNRDYLHRWRRPDPRAIVQFCSLYLDWSPVYVLHHLLPIIALWDLRHPQLYNSVSKLNSERDLIDDAVVLKPLRVIKKRTVNFVESYEIEWRRLDFDIWTPRNCSESLKDIQYISSNTESLPSKFNTNSSENLADFYHFPVPVVEFQQIYPDMCAKFNRLSVKPQKKNKFRNKRMKEPAKEGTNILDLLKDLSLNGDSESQSTNKCSHKLAYSNELNGITTTFEENLKITNTSKSRLPIWDSDSSIEIVQPSESYDPHSSCESKPTDIRLQSTQLNNSYSAFGLITRCSSDPVLWDSALKLECSLLIDSPGTNATQSAKKQNYSVLSLSSDNIDLSPFKTFRTPKSLKDRLANLNF